MIGGLIGYVLCPIALFGFVAPFTVFLSSTASAIIGYSLVAVAVGIVLCNVYLCCRRCVVTGSASYFPLFGAIAASGGIVALFGLVWWIPAIVICVLADVFGQPILGGVVVAMLRLDAPRGG